jgi:hypothetical protein
MKKMKLNWRVVSSLAIITLVAIGAVIGARALFNDTEQSAGNNITAGDLNLIVGSTCHYNGKVCALGDAGKYYWSGTEEECFCSWSAKDLSGELFFNLPNVMPGDNGENTVNLKVEDNDAWICGIAKNITSDDNGCTNSESKIDSTCGAGEGELDDNLFFTAWKDADCDNVLDLPIAGVPEVPAHCESITENPSFQQICASSGDIQQTCEALTFFECVWIPYQPAVPGQLGEQVLAENQKAVSSLWPIADATTGSGPIKAGENYCLGISWNVPLETGNIIQTDSVKGDMEFFAVQSDNMADFSCADFFKETCDGIDNDFDGVIDDGGVCWTSPTSNNDPDYWWRDESYGRDGSTDTAAKTEWMSLGQWTDTLTYYFDTPVLSNKLRFYSTGNGGSNIEIKAVVDGVSQLVYSGDNSYGWLEKSINPAGEVSQIDIRGTNAYDPTSQVLTQLFEIQALRTP